MAHPVILAIESSQRVAGVALRTADGGSHVEMLAQQQRHDDDLLPAIDRLFVRTGASKRSMAAVGVSVGPGGFTGLRIAVSTAKMFAEALGAQVVAIPSALVAAMAYGSDEASAGFHPQLSAQRPAVGGNPRMLPQLAVALASKKDSCWITYLQCDGDVWRIMGSPAPGIVTATSFDPSGIEVLLADSYLPDAFRARCAAADIDVVPPVFDPLACLELAVERFAAGEVIDPLLLRPLYPREPEAVTIWRQRRSDDVNR